MTKHPLIFLCGLPRSGTTWIAKIFDSHPDTLYRHEPDSSRRLNAIPLAPAINGDLASYREQIEAFVADLPNIRTTKVAASLPIFPKSYFSFVTYQLHRTSAFLAKTASRFLGEISVPNFVATDKIGQIQLVWKSIESLARLGVIARAVDNCHSVQIIRHPCGYVASVLRGESLKRFVENEPSHEDYGVYELLLETEQASRYGLDLDLIKKMHPVERLAWRWVLFNEKAMDDTENLDQCTIVRYEDFCHDPFKHSHKLFEFTGLPWQTQTENFITQSTTIERSSYYSIFKNPARAANAWKNELSIADIQKILQIVENTKAGKFALA
jgi:hypothetical protein